MVEFDQMWFIFQHGLPCGPHTSSIGVALQQCLDSCDIEALILILKKVLNCRYDLIIGLLLLLSHRVAEQKIVRWCQIRRIWRVINQFKATVTHSSHCNHIRVCRSIVLVKQDSLHQFSRPFWNVSSTTFQSPELLIQCGFIWKETMQLVSGKVEFNACPSLLWHNSFLVNLWTFHFSANPCTLLISCILDIDLVDSSWQPCFINTHWASKETYLFCRVTLTKTHHIKINHLWTQISDSSLY